MIVVVTTTILFYQKSEPQLFGWRKYLLIFLRSIALVFLVILLLNPILYFIQHLKERPKIIFLEDISDSMKQKNKQVSKTQIFKQISTQLAENIATKNYEVIHYKFADGLDKNSNSTNLSNSLLELSQKSDLSKISSIFLFSDGWFKDDDFSLISALKIPIFTVNPDFKSDYFDLMIDGLDYNKTAYKGESTPLKIQINSHFYEKKATVKLIIKNKTVQTKNVDFADNNFVTVNFEHAFQNNGLQHFKVVVGNDSLDEINKFNNQFSGAIQVKNSRTKIVLISEKLNWEVKFIIDAIKTNSRWNVQFLRKSNGLFNQQKRTTLKNEINDASLLIFINENNLKFSQNEKKIIENFHKTDGGLIFFGKPISTLSNLTPVQNSKINSSFETTFSTTKNCSKYETFNIFSKTKNIPPVRYFYVNPKVQSEILAKFNNDEKSAAIILNDERNILHFAFTNFWKWQLWDDGDKYHDFIGNIITWFAQKKSERFVAFTDKNSYFLNENIKITLSAFDETLSPISDLNCKMLIFNKNNNLILEKFMLNNDDNYFVKFKLNKAGNHHYLIEDEKTNQSINGEFMVNEDNPENFDRDVNLPLLAYISEQTGGKLIENSELQKFSLPTAKTIKFSKNRAIPIYQKWFFLSIFLLSFCGELFFRKRWGLL